MDSLSEEWSVKIMAVPRDSLIVGSRAESKGAKSVGERCGGRVDGAAVGGEKERERDGGSVG